MPLNLEMLKAFTTPGPDGKLPTLSVFELKKLAPAAPDAWKADLLFLAKEGGLNIVQGKRPCTEGGQEQIFWIQPPKQAAPPAPTTAPPIPKAAGPLTGAPGGTVSRMSPASPGPKIEAPRTAAPAAMALAGPGICALSLKGLRISSSGGRTKLTASPASPADAHALLEFASLGSGENSEVIFATLTREAKTQENAQGKPKEAPAAEAQALPVAGSGPEQGETAAAPEIEPPEADFEAAEDLDEGPWAGEDLPGPPPAPEKPRRKTQEEISQELADLDIPSGVRAATLGMMSPGAGENKAKGNI